MKKVIMPTKFVLFFTFVNYVFCPLLLYLGVFVVHYLLTLGKGFAPYYVIFMGMAFGTFFELAFIFAPEYCKLIFKDGTVTNYIGDNTYNDGWCEDISNIKKIELVDKSEVQKYYRQFDKNQAILIDFGNYNIKYIWVGLFSKRQIKKIMKLLSSHLNNETRY